VQGPRAVELVSSLAPAADAARIAALGNYRATTATVAGRPAAVSRTGYTGEDGVELVTDAATAVAVWDAIHAVAVPAGGAACGLGARDTLRLEAGMPLYGHELREDSDPFAIGLGLAFDLDGRSFPGADHYRRLRQAAAPRRRVGIVFDSRRAAREGDRVQSGGRDVGGVTSGSFAPSVGAGVAMALVDVEAAVAGSVVEAVVRESRLPGRVVPLPFWRRDRTAAG
jgi:aminomethyltransferase